MQVLIGEQLSGQIVIEVIGRISESRENQYFFIAWINGIGNLVEH